MVAAAAKPASDTAAFIASKAAKTLSDALTADLLVISTQTRPSKRKKALIGPTNLEFHLNPAALGIAAVGAGLTLWLMQMRVHPRDTTVYNGEWYYSDGTIAAKTISLSAEQPSGDPPKRTQTIPGTGHYETQYDHMGAPHQVWVQDTVEWTGEDIATWRLTGSKAKQEYKISQRQGFGLDALTELPQTAAAAPGVILDVIMHPFKYVFADLQKKVG